MLQLLTAVASERPLISFDGTLVLNIALWLVLFFVLRPVLWEPMVKLLSAREGGMQGSRTSAKGAADEAAARRAEYEGALKSARSSAAGERDKLRAEALRRESEILAETRSKVAAAVDAQRDAIKEQRDTLSKEIAGAIPQLAKDIAAKALGREVAS
jgi:F-type H+-transporting ATPase subunit b